MQVDVWSDIACPWCYVGKRRLEAAIAAYEGADPVNVTWHSFELDPSAPAAYDTDAAAHLALKYGRTQEQAAAMLEQLTELASGDGLDLRFDISRGGNTFDGHRVVQLALRHGKQGEMKERLMRAYFTDGELVSDHATLRRLALEVGLPATEVDELLAGDELAEDVRTDEYTAAQLGIDAVPFFVVDRRYAARGAQPAEYLAEVLQRAAADAA